MKKILKLINREIKQNIIRFIVLLVVSFFGVGIFAGLFSCVPNLKHTVESYYGDTNFHDIKLTASLGFSEGDIEKLLALDYIDSVEAVYSLHSVSNINGEGNFGTYLRTVNMDSLSANASTVADMPKLISGSYPVTDNSCLVVQSAAMQNNIKIGDKIALISNTDSCTQTVFTVTGFVTSPEFSSDIKENSDTGDRKIEIAMYVPEGTFRKPANYNELLVSVKKDENLSPFSDEYSAIISSAKAKLGEASGAFSQQYSQELSQQDKDKLDKAQKQLEFVKNETQRQLKEYANNIKNLENKVGEQKADIKAREEGLSKLKEQAEFIKVNGELPEGPTLAEIAAQIAAGEAELSVAQDDLMSAEFTLNQLNSEHTRLKQLAAEKVANAQAQLNSATSLKSEYNQKWFIYTRNDNMGYASVSMNTEKLSAISGYFPWIFFIACLTLVVGIALNMLISSRREMGAMSAMGFAKKEIISRYAGFVFTAVFIGAVSGALVGTLVIPQLILKIYGRLYVYPEIALSFLPDIVLIPSLSVVLLATLSAWLICAYILKQPASELMANGSSRERISFARFIPERLLAPLPEFLREVINNTLLYKKRLVTLLICSISCTALLISGFAVNSKVGNIAELQQQIQKYDIVARLSGDYTEKEPVMALLSDKQKVSGYCEALSGKLSLIVGENAVSAEVISPKSDNKLEEFFSLKAPSGKSLELSADAVIISENTAKKYGIKKGDALFVGSKEGVKLTVTAISKNHIGNFAVLGSGSAAALPSNTLSDTLIIKTCSPDLSRAEVTAALCNVNNISSVVFLEESLSAYTNSGDIILNITRALNIISAALLSVAMLFFISENITERKRENFENSCSTALKTSFMIFTENMLLTLLGVIFGIILGIILYSVTAAGATASDVYYPRFAGGLPILFAVLISLGVSAVINAAMYLRIRVIGKDFKELMAWAIRAMKYLFGKVLIFAQKAGTFLLGVLYALISLIKAKIKK